MGLTLSPGNIKTNLPHFTQLVERHIESWVQSCERSPQGEQAVSLCLDDAVSAQQQSLPVKQSYCEQIMCWGSVFQQKEGVNGAWSWKVSGDKDTARHTIPHRIRTLQGVSWASE
eukprot:1139091-Pelagomonas_calceolata.AAC.4